ncbi:DegT/DnrJ/EryC1/StrS family aminotransferase [Horticoccus sp. 23ND18S-11]|uniref:DegT/DnrJ/EryC1/StrS family aminotransferase n=1 Tax=Horticoccus sp. 23ND18S-11 TaxID=3391832 RepID=UPI0039C9502E
MSVPLLDLNRQNASLHSELVAAFEKVLRSGHFILGGEVESFEREAAAFLGAKHAISVSSGTDAILVALMALGIGPGDEVICPSFTFFATAGCIARLGATPVFADVHADTFNLDAADVARRITPRTKAIMPVHLFGQSAAMEPLLALARQHNLAVIEDAAQALGARQHGRCCGTIGDFGTYSFFPSKNLGGFGDGGLVATNRDDLAEKVRLLRTHGSKPKYYHKVVGGNFRLDALQCALLRIKLPHLPAYCAARQRNAAYYGSRLAGLGGLTLPQPAVGNDHIWNQYTLRVGGHGRRDALRQHLTAAGIGAEIYYPLPLHQQECFAGLPKVSLPTTEALAREVISIPIFPELTEREKTEVADSVIAFSKLSGTVAA